jgi:hypothetical protein
MRSDILELLDAVLGTIAVIGVAIGLAFLL